jgi:hypothetical protein
MEKSSFFNSINGDRKYLASDFAVYFAKFIGNGVFPNPSNNLQVMSNGDMTVTVKAGAGWINGYMYLNDSDLILPIDVADGVLNRIDRIVLRMDTAGRAINSIVKKGTFASSPVAPTLQRDADGYELGLADIYVAAGATQITQANITDLRLDNNFCGIVHGTVDQIDLTTLFNQYTVGFQAKEVDFENEFTTWFNTVKNQLSGDVAGNLQNEIGALTSLNTTEKSNLVGAVNEVNNNLASLSADNTTFENNTNSSIDAINVKLSDYNAYASSVDANGIYTIMQYKRADGTLYMKSTLSGGTSPNYTTDTWQFYDNLGTTVIATKTWTITYDANGKITSKVVA